MWTRGEVSGEETGNHQLYPLFGNKYECVQVRSVISCQAQKISKAGPPSTLIMEVCV